ncbi:sporulation histidine kinase inhibitor Sda [Sporosarcina aquimarina]|uniref:sporulation histidine kinase inhibitor Sda n=1 Tax=Sporosarcina aquimarina TaxID=114975 RepID=UPI00203CD57B|nr:sporulation histidine kinase inhibitor Sda [Sporosarcina aquimarina]MCM3756366.1 sporulation histidine kinase inhibitor Sda [Sporosarcina aquimarina]
MNNTMLEEGVVFVNKLPDDLLIISYVKALELELSAEFINLLKCEVNKRSLLCFIH